MTTNPTIEAGATGTVPADPSFPTIPTAFVLVKTADGQQRMCAVDEDIRPVALDLPAGKALLLLLTDVEILPDGPPPLDGIRHEAKAKLRIALTDWPRPRDAAPEGGHE